MPFFSLSISNSMRLLVTKAISMPEKKADSTMVTTMPMINEISTASFIFVVQS